MTEADLIVQHRYYASLPLDYWQAKCKHCGKWLTKYDESRDQCVRLALSEGHDCQPAAQLGLL